MLQGLSYKNESNFYCGKEYFQHILWTHLIFTKTIKYYYLVLLLSPLYKKETEVFNNLSKVT